MNSPLNADANENLQSILAAEYVFNSLHRIRHKKYESYVIQRIIHLLNDPSIKFVTQQYVRKSNGKIALTDLFFPQFNLHIEIDEPHHQHEKNIEADQVREYDIITVTGHDLQRVQITPNITLAALHARIDQLICHIQTQKQIAIEQHRFQPWRIDTEYKAATYIERGYLAVEDQVVFRHVHEICNCFGYQKSLSQVQQGGIAHAKDPNLLIWWPRLYPNAEWDNHVSHDAMIITEKSHDLTLMQQKVQQWLNGEQQRIVFARVKDCLSRQPIYRFLGVYQLESASVEQGGIWKRIATRIETVATPTLLSNCS